MIPASRLLSRRIRLPGILFHRKTCSSRLAHTVSTSPSAESSKTLIQANVRIKESDAKLVRSEDVAASSLPTEVHKQAQDYTEPIAENTIPASFTGSGDAGIALQIPSVNKEAAKETAPLPTQSQEPAQSLQPSSVKPPAYDHREVAVKQNLFFTNPASPGSPIFLPNGAHIFNKLTAFLRAQYAYYGFQEVVTPTIYKKHLWEASGHWDKYANDMFKVTGRGATGESELTEFGEDEEYGLKPMNCPGHCLIFRSAGRSYRELPLRFADFSPLHR